MSCGRLSTTAGARFGNALADEIDDARDVDSVSRGEKVTSGIEQLHSFAARARAASFADAREG